MIAVSLVTLDFFKAQRSILNDNSDDHLAAIVYASTLVVMNYCKLTAIPDEWLSDDPPAPAVKPAEFVPTVFDESPLTSPPTIQYVHVPGNIEAAISLVAGELFENREANSNPMSPAVIALLTPYRDPTFA